MMLHLTGIALIAVSVALTSIRLGQPMQFGEDIAQFAMQNAMVIVWIAGGAFLCAAIPTGVAIMITTTSFIVSLAITLMTLGNTESTNAMNWSEIGTGAVYTASAMGICLSIAVILMVGMAQATNRMEAESKPGKRIETTVIAIAGGAAVLISEGSINDAPWAWEVCVLMMTILPISGAAIAAITAARIARRANMKETQQRVSARHDNATIIAQITDAGLQSQRYEDTAQDMRLRAPWRIWMDENGLAVLAHAQKQHNRKNHPASGMDPRWATPSGHDTMVSTDTWAIAQHIAERWNDYAQREQIEPKHGNYEENRKRKLAHAILERAPGLREDWDKRCAQSLRARKETLERDTIIGVLVTIGAAASLMHNEIAAWAHQGAGIIACVAMGLSVARGHCALIARATLRATQQ